MWGLAPETYFFRKKSKEGIKDSTKKIFCPQSIECSWQQGQHLLPEAPTLPLIKYLEAIGTKGMSSLLLPSVSPPPRPLFLATKWEQRCLCALRGIDMFRPLSALHRCPMLFWSNGRKLFEWLFPKQGSWLQVTWSLAFSGHQI